MFLMRFIRYLLGYVQFLAEGGGRERFLNAAAQDGVALWAMRPVDGGLAASTLARNIKKLRAISARTGMRLNVTRCVGLPFRAKKYKKRGGLITGALLFIAILWFFSSFIWVVDVSGNSGTKTAEITAVLSDLGLRPGAFPMLLNVKSIEQQALIRLPDLAWLTININGTAAEVKVSERDYPPEIVPRGLPCNLRAERDGQLLSLEVYEGKPAVRVGDTISKGGLLVSGVVTDKNGNVLLMHASGKAIARTSRELSVTVPCKQRVRQDTGKAVTKNTLDIFSFSVPLYFSKPSGDYRITIKTDQLKLLGLTLPFSVTHRSYIRQQSVDVVYTQAQAAAIAAEKLKQEEKTELAGAKILSSNTEPKAEENGYTLVGHYTCEENIAVEEAVALS